MQQRYENVREAIVFRLYDGRYFRAFGKGGRLITAWSLAGAHFFGDWQRNEMAKVTKKLTKKKRRFIALNVSTYKESLYI